MAPPSGQTNEFERMAGGRLPRRLCASEEASVRLRTPRIAAIANAAIDQALLTWAIAPAMSFRSIGRQLRPTGRARYFARAASFFWIAAATISVSPKDRKSTRLTSSHLGI